MYGALLFNIAVLVVFLLFYFRNKKKARHALHLAIKSFWKIGPLLLIVMIFLIFSQRIFSGERVITYLTHSSGPLGYLIAAFLGTVVHIPLFVAFPIGGQLLQSGVNPGLIAVLITSLVMVHTFSIPIEIKELGTKFAVYRNVLSFVFAICIGVIMGLLY